MAKAPTTKKPPRRPKENGPSELIRMAVGEQIGTEEERARARDWFERSFPPGHPQREALIRRTINGTPRAYERDYVLPDFVKSFGRPARVDARTRSIYVIGFGAYVKIGFTDTPVSRRIASLQTGCPENLEVYAILPGDRILEYDLHQRFADLRLRGEWFKREGALAEWIEAGCPLEGGDQ